jgi:hypothetical protein
MEFPIEKHKEGGVFKSCYVGKNEREDKNEEPQIHNKRRTVSIVDVTFVILAFDIV